MANDHSRLLLENTRAYATRTINQLMESEVPDQQQLAQLLDQLRQTVDSYSGLDDLIKTDALELVGNLAKTIQEVDE